MKCRAATVPIVLLLVLLAVSFGPLRFDSAVSAASHRIYLPLLTRSPAAPPPNCAHAPQLIAPSDGSTLDTLIPVFEWDAGDSASATELHLEVCHNHDCTDFEYRARASHWAHGRWGHQPVENLQSATTYYWRAYLMCGEAQGPYSAMWSFTTGSGGDTLPAPQLVSPADGSALPGQEVTVEWTPVTGAVGYQINLVHGGFHEGKFTTETSWILDELEANSSYEWWVVGRNDYAWGDESAHWTFTTGVATQVGQ